MCVCVCVCLKNGVSNFCELYEKKSSISTLQSSHGLSKDKSFNAVWKNNFFCLKISYKVIAMSFMTMWEVCVCVCVCVSI